MSRTAKTIKDDGFEQLSDRQKKFCLEYLKDFNASRSYVEAGYSARSEKSISSSSSQLLANPRIQGYMRHAVNKIIHDDITQIRKLIVELQLIAFGDVRDLASWDGEEVKLRSSKELGHKSRMISEISSSKNHSEFGINRNMKIKTHDKLKALELLGKYYKIFANDNLSDQNNTINLNYKIEK